MAIADERLISLLITEDDELKRCVEEHRELDKKIVEMTKRKYLTPEQDFKRKLMQKRKLIGKDRIQKILVKYRSNKRVIF